MPPSLAIIGAGSIGEKHAAAAQAANASVRWIIDANEQRARELATTVGAETSDTLDAALQDDDVDGIIIGVPNRFHQEMAIDALNAGKSVLLEKPMAISARECHEINNVAAKASSILQIGFVHRYTAVGLLAKELITAGKVGTPYHAKAHLYFRRGIPGLGKWFTTKAMSGGGSLIDVGVHLIDLAMFMLDYPEVNAVAGQTYTTFGSPIEDYTFESMWAGPPDPNGTFDVEDSAHAFVRMESGATLDLHVAWAGNYPTANLPTTMMGCFGDRGGIAFELFGDHVNLTHEVDGKLIDQRIEAQETDPFLLQLNAFLKSMASGEAHGATGREGEIVQGIIDAIYQSSQPSTLSP